MTQRLTRSSRAARPNLGVSDQLLQDLQQLARTPSLLVACNYGGTLSYHGASDVPSKLLPESATALRALAALPNTHTAVMSGRTLRDLAADSRLPREVHLVGSNGAEFDSEFFGTGSTDAAPRADDSGAALDRLRNRLGVSAAFFAGDASSDEFAMSTLHGPDMGVRIGDGDTKAAHRITGPETLASLLALLFELRKDWLFGQDVVAIERHSMLGDGTSTALVTPEARICWMTHPQPDSGSLFASILGSEEAGHFSIDPVKKSRVLGQRYVDNTMIVETRWADVTVTDYLEPSPLGITNLVRVLTGTGSAKIIFAPRPDYAAAYFNMHADATGVHITGSRDPITLTAPGVEFTVTSDGRNETATAVVDLSQGPVVLNLRCGDTDAYVPDCAAEPARRAVIAAKSRSWVSQLDLPGVKPSLVGRSALVLRALCYEPTGAVLAASTTSLPEGIGGTRNWDYRYCWLRDGSMTVKALVDLGSTVEAEGFLHWLDGILQVSPGAEWLHPLYSITGSSLGAEASLESLPGYAGSRPVRIGNAADNQVQLDVFGPIAELIDTLSARNGEVTEFQWGLLSQMVNAVASRWQEPDHGIWEARRSPRHHTYTKTMCWVTVDRALRVAARHGRTVEPEWELLALTIREDVLVNGWDDDVKSYTVAYDSPDLDAAVLHIGLSGLLDVSDPRFAQTVSAVERELRVGPTVFRYRYDDGLPGLEGGFHICTTWLIESYLATGRFDEAEALFNQLIILTGPTGLLSEEFDPATETHLGNHPQAYSHLGFIRCAQLLDAHRKAFVAVA
ncbi:bifunctional trehalose-phosphatase/glycoside hydrolase family 15 protein [Cryobacterium melibiosiphilum]|uniref:Bifunctional trehalose-phosphatase/glycoside hydrolase family 15 protein n=1 Tax=Cryobacterium melibiosiphilum TaxID=995039 RepID=A0A3A5MVT4_9MICO|nr:trehalase-like domain-containing protein [Cryobacterium melibiosiphilum]RJT90126.1 bifunctional trehalose-phosphatase/glycoside hydrolase family 15 protein [Cryobacterium melibiosiphilum]